MLLLLPVLVQSYSLGSSLPARTRAARSASVRLAEGQSDYMLQELNPAKAGILCVAHGTAQRTRKSATARLRGPTAQHSTAQHSSTAQRSAAQHESCAKAGILCAIAVARLAAARL